MDCEREGICKVGIASSISNLYAAAPTIIMKAQRHNAAIG
jgi:hypothetical protein